MGRAKVGLVFFVNLNRGLILESWRAFLYKVGGDVAARAGTHGGVELSHESKQEGLL